MPMVPRRLPMQKSAETTQLYHSCCGKKAGDCPGCPEPCTLVKKAQLQVPTFSPNQIQHVQALQKLYDGRVRTPVVDSARQKRMPTTPNRRISLEDIKATDTPESDYHINISTPSGRNIRVNIEQLARNLGIPTDDVLGATVIPEEVRERLRHAAQTYNKYRGTVQFSAY